MTYNNSWPAIPQTLNKPHFQIKDRKDNHDKMHLIAWITCWQLTFLANHRSTDTYAMQHNNICMKRNVSHSHYLFITLVIVTSLVWFPLVCMSKCHRAINETPNCSWCAGRHLHGSHRHQCMNVCINYCKSLWTKASAKCPTCKCKWIFLRQPQDNFQPCLWWPKKVLKANPISFPNPIQHISTVLWQKTYNI